jgi:hypothetical protein
MLKKKMFKCSACDSKPTISKGDLTPGGKQTYIVTCFKEFTTFQVDWDEYQSNLPCGGDEDV